MPLCPGHAVFRDVVCVVIVLVTAGVGLLWRGSHVGVCGHFVSCAHDMR